MGPPEKRHRCLLADVDKKMPSGSDSCRPGNPALLPPEKVKLHYVVHYLSRGYFDKWVPEPSEEKKLKIEMYVCNVCKKKFRNMLAKKEYPGRGSVICHIATEHGKILEVMREDKEANMKKAIDLLITKDAQLKKLNLEGTKTSFDDDLVKVVEASIWSLGHVQKLSKEEANRKSTSSVEANNAVRNEQSNSTPENTQQTANKDAPQGRNNLLHCPKCTTFKPTRERSSLKFHLIEHYAHAWISVYTEAAIPDNALEYPCNKCPKRISGSTPRGLRNAIICHWALQHGELNHEMRKDKDIDPKLIDILNTPDPKINEKNVFSYSVSTTPTNKPTERTQLTPRSKPCPASKKKWAKFPQKKRMAFQFSSESSDEDPLDLDLSSASDSDNLSSPSKHSRPGPRCSKVKAVPSKSGELNKCYIRKRPKINFTLDEDDDDSDDWLENNKDTTNNRPKRKLSTRGARDSIPLHKRIVPRRAVAKNIDFVGETQLSEDEDDM